MSIAFESPLAAFFGDLLKNNSTADLVQDNSRTHTPCEPQSPLPNDNDEQRMNMFRWESDPSLYVDGSCRDIISRWRSDAAAQEDSEQGDEEDKEVRRRKTSLTKPKRTNSNEHEQYPELTLELSKIGRTRRHRKPSSDFIKSPQMPLRKSSITADASKMIEEKRYQLAAVAG